MDISMGADVLLVRVFNDEEKDWALQSDRLLDREFRYFLDDISGDKHMLANIAVYNPRNELVENLNRIQL